MKRVPYSPLLLSLVLFSGCSGTATDRDSTDSDDSTDRDSTDRDSTDRDSTDSDDSTDRDSTDSDDSTDSEDSDDSTDSEDSTDSGSAGDGDSNVSEASCDNWKDAYCAWMQSCGSVGLSECRAQVETVVCSPKAPLERCVTELSDSCSPPEGCDAIDVADTATAKAECNRFLGAYCSNFLACQPSAYSDLSSCTSTTDLNVGCSTAYAVSDQYDSCIAELNTTGCGEYLPVACNDVVFRQ